MWEYVKSNIYNNRISAKDIREGRTGFNHLDSLDPKTRSRLSQENRKIWESMNSDQQARFILDFEALIRKRQRSDSRLKGLDSYDIIRHIANVDGPRALDYIMSYLDEHNKLEELAELQSKETFAERAAAAFKMMEEGKIIINPNEL